MFSLAFALAVAAAPAPVPVEAGGMEQLERVYQQSCAERAYGSYNDLCDQMRRDIRAYRRRNAAGARALAPAAAARPIAPQSEQAQPRPAALSSGDALKGPAQTAPPPP